MSQAVLEIDNLHIDYRTARGIARVVDGVSLRVETGEKVAIVGESGCGKTQTVRAVLRLLPEDRAIVSEGRMLFRGQDIIGLRRQELRELRTQGISMIYQEPSAVLNPVFTIGEQLIDIIRHSLQGTGRRPRKSELHSLAIRAISDVNIPDPERVLRFYPHQLSGGMKQRVCIAMAIVLPRHLLIADEPGTALDVTLQAQINSLIDKLVTSKNLALILITHSLGVARELTDRIYVMYAGTIVETARTAELFDRPLHPYTRGLLACVPKLSGHGIAEGIKGHVPDYLDMPDGCRFAPRCPIADERCSRQRPVLENRGNEHSLACFFADDLIRIP
jgi:peptide/nickel transport system ATP-binding protein